MPKTSAEIVQPESSCERISAVGSRSSTASIDGPVYLNRLFCSLPPYMNCTRLRNSPCAGVMVDGAPLRERLCLIEAIRGADRLSLVKAYGEALACAVCGTQAQADPLATEIIESIRRYIFSFRERQMAERSALRARGRREEREMDDRQRSEIAEAEASLRRLHGDGFDFA